MFLAANNDLIFVCDAARFRESKAAHHRPPIRLFLHTQSSCIPQSLLYNTLHHFRMSIMSFNITIAMFVTCSAPLFLVYFVVGGIHMLQLDKTTYVGDKADFDPPSEIKSYVVICVAFVVAWTVLSMCIAMYGGSKRDKEEQAHPKAIIEDVRRSDETEMEWFDINFLKEDVGLDEEEAKRFHFFDVDGDVSLESGSKEDNIANASLGSAGDLGWCVVM